MAVGLDGILLKFIKLILNLILPFVSRIISTVLTGKFEFEFEFVLLSAGCPQPHGFLQSN
jgi:hypothetical protein